MLYHEAFLISEEAVRADRHILLRYKWIHHHDSWDKSINAEQYEITGICYYFRTGSMLKAISFRFTFMLVGSSNMVTGETKSFFTFAKSVSAPHTVMYSHLVDLNTILFLHGPFFLFYFIMKALWLVGSCKMPICVFICSGGRWRRLTLSNCMKKTKSWLDFRCSASSLSRAAAAEWRPLSTSCFYSTARRRSNL